MKISHKPSSKWVNVVHFFVEMIKKRLFLTANLLTVNTIISKAIIYKFSTKLSTILIIILKSNRLFKRFQLNVGFTANQIYKYAHCVLQLICTQTQPRRKQEAKNSQMIQNAKVKCIIETKAYVGKVKWSRNGTKTHVGLHIIVFFYLIFTVCCCDKDRNVKSIFQKWTKKKSNNGIENQ